MSLLDFFTKQSPTEWLTKQLTPKSSGMRFNVGEGLNQPQAKQAQQTVRKLVTPVAPNPFDNIKNWVIKSITPPVEDFAKIGKAIPQTTQPITNAISSYGKGVGDITMGILQGTARSGGSVGATLMGEKEIPVEDKYSQLLFGKGNIESLGTRIEKFPQRAGEVGVPENISKPLAPFAILGITALDFTGAGGLKTVTKMIAKSKKASEIAGVLKNIGVADDLIDDYAEVLVKVTKESEVTKVLNHIDEIQKTTKVTKPLNVLDDMAIKSNPLIAEAKKYKTAEEFVKANSRKIETLKFDNAQSLPIKDSYAEDLGDVLGERLFNDSNNIIGKNLLEYLKADVNLLEMPPEKVKMLFGKNRTTSKTAVAKYVSEIKKGADFPPVYIYKGGFVDGGHRVEAYILAGKKSIKVMDISNLVDDAINFGKGEGWDISPKSQLTDIWKKANPKTALPIKSNPLIQEAKTLPKEISIHDEAKAVGAKRIAPDRVAHQQLTPERGIESLVNKAKDRANSNSNSWIKVSDTMQGLVNKYGDKFPARTAENMQKYPDSINDFYKYNNLKKYSNNPRSLSGMKDEFLQRAERAKWSPNMESSYRAKVGDEYKNLIKIDISKGYKYPDEVLNYDKSFKTAVDNRARYEKGLATSFSADDSRIVFDNENRIVAGMKRQDGKELLPAQKQEIINGVLQTQKALGIDLNKMSKDERWVYAHLNGKNPFLTKNAAGMYRRGGDYASVSLGGSESFDAIINGEKVRQKVNTTAAHEIGHALDGNLKGKFLDNQTVWDLKRTFKPVENSSRGSKYWKSDSEITARAIEEYVAVKEGHTGLFNREGYWTKEIFDSKIKPAVEKSIDGNFSQYKTSLKPIPSIDRSTGKGKIRSVSEVEPIVSKSVPLKTAESAIPKSIAEIPPKSPLPPSQLIPQELEKSPLSSVNKIINALKEAKPVRGQQEKLYSQERKLRMAKALSVGKNTGGEAGYFKELGQLKGEMPRAQFEAVRGKIGQADIDDLFEQVKKSKLLNFWDSVSARGGLMKILEGRVPTEGEITLLNRVFPKEFMDTVLSKRSFWAKATEAGYQLANIPRSIMSSFDLSAPFRQGLFLTSHPKRFTGAFKDMFKAFGSEKAFKAINEDIVRKPTFELMKESKLALTEMDNVLTLREEAFASQWAEKIPGVGIGVRASGRAYSAFLNKLRADVFDDLINKADRLGLQPKSNLDLTKNIATFINVSSGRGGLGKLQPVANTLNSVFFSPRLMASRLTILNPLYYINAEPFVRKEALKSLFTVLGAGSVILGLAKLGGANVGTEPRSADFGKIIIGKTRIDVWGGMQQYIRMFAQVGSGQYVSSVTGKLVTLGEGYKPLTRFDILQRQIESKEAPVFSFITALLRGKNFMGEKFEISKEVANRFIPMAISDIYEVYKNDPEIMPAGFLGMFGFGLQTYSEDRGKLPSESEKKDTYEISKILGDRARESEELTSASKIMYDALKKMPKEQAAEAFDNLIKENPKMAEKINGLIEDDKLGLTFSESYIKQLGAENGDRARFIFEKLNKLKTKEEKADYFDGLIKKKVITKKVSEQIIYLMNQKKE